MKIFNLMAKLAMVFALIVGLNSCNKEDNNGDIGVEETKTLIGAWIQEYNDFDYKGSITLTFDKNGIYEIKDQYTSDEWGDEWNIEKGRYTIDGSIISLIETSYENSDGDKNETEDNNTLFAFFEIDGSALTIYNIKSSDFSNDKRYESVEDIKADGYKVSSPEVYSRK